MWKITFGRQFVSNKRQFVSNKRQFVSNKRQFVSNIRQFVSNIRQFVSNKRQNGLTDRAQILCGTSHDPGKGLWNIKVGGKILENSWNLIV